jgi:predicted permease
MQGLFQDLRVGLRILRKSPAQMAAAVVTLALGIAAVTTVFGWVDAVLLRPLPGTLAPNELVAIEEISPDGQALSCAHPDFRDFQRDADLLSGLSASHLSVFTAGTGEGARRVFGQIVSANFFAVLGVKPVIGRVFSPDEDRDIPGAYPYAVISDRMWRSRFGADPRIIGRPLRINGRQLTVIGVAPPDFQGSVTGLALDIWVPLSLIHEMGGVGGWPVTDRNAKPYSLIGRLKPGTKIEQAAAQIRTIARRMAAAHPATHAGVSATALPVWKAHSGVQAVLLWPLRILAAVSLLVLLIASANVANLLLARSVSREREYGVRLALGASRYRLLRQALAEALLLAAAGTAAGMLLTQWMGESLKLLLPPTELPLTGFVSAELNGPVVAFAALVCGATALLSGVVPGLHSARSDLAGVLNEGGKTAAPGRRSHRARKALVTGEVALASLALIVAGLFGKSFQNISAIHPGLDANNVHVAQLYLAAAGYTADREKQFCRSLVQKLQNVHGIESATYMIELPLLEGGNEAIQVEGYQPRAGESTIVDRNNVGPGYFRLLRIPLLAGREFDERDEAGSPRVLVVNQEFARRFFGDADPIGRRVRIALGRDWATIVGVVKDSKHGNPAKPVQPFFYAPFQQMFASGHGNYFLIRASGNPADALSAFRREAAALDPTGGLYRLQPLTDFLQAALYAHKVAAVMMGVLGALALLLAAVGAYGVLAYSTSERTQEIGIRMALGANPHDVFRMVLWEGLGMTITGIAIGALAALAVSRLVTSMMVGVGTADPVAFGGAAFLLCAIALLASYLPARRAIGIGPMQALRRQ